MRTFLLLVAVLGGTAAALAQNLVRNGSFEEFYFCPDGFTTNYQKRFLPGWIMPTKGTPDYFNRCSKESVGVPQNFMGSIFPADGDGFIGIVLLDTPKAKDEIDYSRYFHAQPVSPVNITNLKKPKLLPQKAKSVNYREYVQTTLRTPLQRNMLYRVGFRFAVAQHSTYLINRLGVLFTNEPVKAKKGVLDYTPQIALDTSVFYFEQGYWYEIADTFRANGGELFLTIGNFYDDSRTDFIPNDISGLNTDMQRKVLVNQVAYVYLDDIRVEPVTPNTVKSDIRPKFYRFSLLSFHEVDRLAADSAFMLLDEVYFDIGNPDMECRSFMQLRTLARYLIERENTLKELRILGMWHQFEAEPDAARERADFIARRLIDFGVSPDIINVKSLDLKANSSEFEFYDRGIKRILYSSLIALRLTLK